MTKASEESDDLSLARARALAPVTDWLLRSGAGAVSPAALLGDLCDRLAAAEVPIAEALLTISSLDPMVARTRLRWRRRDRRVAEEIQFHGMAAVAEPVATASGLRITFPGTHHQIEWLAEAPGTFDTRVCNDLEAICLAMGSSLQAVVERGITRSLLQAYLGRRSADRVLSGTIRRGTGEVIEAVVWISDLRDFTRLSERLGSEQMIAALNDSCARLVGAIQPFGGEVLKFIGFCFHATSTT